jgi:CRP-like cAMP-binding protein
MQHISSTKRQRADIDMRTFAKGAGTTVRVTAGGAVFNKGDPGDCMYIVQSGTIDMMIGDTVIETIGANGVHVDDRRNAALLDGPRP